MRVQTDAFQIIEFLLSFIPDETSAGKISFFFLSKNLNINGWSQSFWTKCLYIFGLLESISDESKTTG